MRREVSRLLRCRLSSRLSKKKKKKKKKKSSSSSSPVETEPSGGEQGLQRRTSNLLLVSMIVLDTVSVWSTGVAGWLAESRCVKREVSRPQVADGYGRGSCEGQLLDADMGPQRRLRSASGLPSRHGTALGLGCYGEAMRRS